MGSERDLFDAVEAAVGVIVEEGRAGVALGVGGDGDLINDLPPHEVTKALRDYRLTTANSATQALQRLQEAMPDLIILDHVLEGSESGLDFLPRFKSAASHVPVIVISGSFNVKQQLAALSGPRSAHYALEKPVDHPGHPRTHPPRPTGRHPRQRNRAGRLIERHNSCAVPGAASASLCIVRHNPFLGR